MVASGGGSLSISFHGWIEVLPGEVKRREVVEVVVGEVEVGEAGEVAGKEWGDNEFLEY